MAIRYKKTIEDRMKRCRHYRSPREYKDCGHGRNYDEVMRKAELGDIGCMLRLPCLGDKPGTQIRGETVEPCNLHEGYTREEVEAEERETERRMELMLKGVSPCCEAPIDESHVIPDGEHKGHGPRFCSKCHRCVFMV